MAVLPGSVVEWMDQHYMVVGIFTTLMNITRIVLGGVSYVNCWVVDEWMNGANFKVQIIMIYLIGENNVKK